MDHSTALNILILASIVSWGVWGTFDKRALQHGSSADVLLTLYAFSVPTAIVSACLLYDHGHWQPAAWLLLWTAGSALAQFGAAAFYLKAMSKMDASWVLGVTAGYPLIMQLLAVAVLGEKLIGMRLLGAGLIAIGVLFIGGSIKKQPVSCDRGQLITISAWALAATVLWGVVGVFDKKAVAAGTPAEAYFIKSMWNVVIFAAYFLWKKWRGACPKLSDAHVWRFCGASAFFLAVGNLAYLQAMSLAPASYVIVITGCYPIVMYLSALFFLHERFNMTRMGGVLTVVIGGLITQLTQTM